MDSTLFHRLRYEVARNMCCWTPCSRKLFLAVQPVEEYGRAYLEGKVKVPLFSWLESEDPSCPSTVFMKYAVHAA